MEEGKKERDKKCPLSKMRPVTTMVVSEDNREAAEAFNTTSYQAPVIAESVMAGQRNCKQL